MDWSCKRTSSVCLRKEKRIKKTVFCHLIIVLSLFCIAYTHVYQNSPLHYRTIKNRLIGNIWNKQLLNSGITLYVVLNSRFILRLAKRRCSSKRKINAPVLFLNCIASL